MKKILAITLLASIVNAQASTKVVYGEDNRVDVFESTNAMYVELANSTAAMISGSKVEENEDGGYDIVSRSLEEGGICSSERFAKQPMAANCSGFLVGEDLLVTAGHCIRNQSSCNKYKWVFDFKVEFDTQAEISVGKDSVYGCKDIVNRALDSWSKDDWALIRLDRAVEGRRFLEYRKSGEPAVGDNLVVIGHPTGLPTKIADGANVRALKDTYFTANLDTYGGNSGSAVFNADTGVVEGILVRGERDYVYDSQNACRVTNVVADDEGRGEDVTYITNIPELR
ncbi:MAG: endopeptidase [Halobacteriovoraceae bacterium]|nr:endopeptidase [Halobacteriovoraceae bacterium]|tara:strand:+ start:207665 stop:208516 length:852 start_codon:yes stop_codon:yes gene_type:complete